MGKFNIPYDVLFDLYEKQKLSSIEIAANFDVDFNKILGLLKYYGIKVRSCTESNKIFYERRKNIKFSAIKNDIEKMLIDNYSVQEIAKFFNITYCSMYKFIKKDQKLCEYVSCSGTSRTQIEYIKKTYYNVDSLTKDKLTGLYVDKEYNMYEIAKMFNMSPSAVLYRMRKFGIPSRDKSTANKLLHKKRPELREIHRQHANDGIIGVFKHGNQYIFTEIERLFEKYCIKNSIEYVRQYQIFPGTHRYDFKVYDKLLVELDGVYWHSKPKQQIKDELQNNIALENGYNIIRFVDSEIKKSKGKCFDRIKEFI